MPAHHDIKAAGGPASPGTGQGHEPDLSTTVSQRLDGTEAGR